MLLFDDYKKDILEEIKKIYSVSEKDIDIHGAYGVFTLKIFKVQNEKEEVYSKIKSTLNKDYIENIELQVFPEMQ